MDHFFAASYAVSEIPETFLSVFAELGTSDDIVQFPMKCKMCQISTDTNWRCFDCDKMLCDHCKGKEHIKLNRALKHKILSIKYLDTKVSMNIMSEYQMEINSKYIHSCTDGSDKIQRVKLDGNNIKTLSTAQRKFNDVAVVPSSNDLIVIYSDKIAKLNADTGEKIDFNYDDPIFYPRHIHVTNEEEMLLAGMFESSSAIILLDKNGRYQKKNQHGLHN